MFDLRLRLELGNRKNQRSAQESLPTPNARSVSITAETLTATRKKERLSEWFRVWFRIWFRVPRICLPRSCPLNLVPLIQTSVSYFPPRDNKGARKTVQRTQCETFPVNQSQNPETAEPTPVLPGWSPSPVGASVGFTCGGSTPKLFDGAAVEPEPVVTGFTRTGEGAAEGRFDVETGTGAGAVSTGSTGFSIGSL